MSPDSGNLNRDASSFTGRILCEDYGYAFAKRLKRDEVRVRSASRVLDVFFFSSIHARPPDSSWDDLPCQRK